MAFGHTIRPQSDWIRTLISVGLQHGQMESRRLVRGIAGGGVALLLGLAAMAAFTLPAEWAPLFVMAVLFPFVMMVMGELRRPLIAIIVLNIPFPLDIHLGYQKGPAALGAIGGLDISATTFALALLYTLELAKLLSNRESRLRPQLRISLPPALYVAFAALSVSVARDRTLALFELFLLLQTFLLYLYVVNTINSKEDFLFIVATLLIGLALEGLVMFGLLLAPNSFSFAGMTTRVDAEAGAQGQFYRISGTLGSPANAAGYLSMLLPTAVALLWTELGHLHKQLAWFSLTIGGLALILTFTRGGWLSFALALAILSGVAWRRWRVPLTIPLAAAAAGLLLSLPFREAVVARLFAEQSAESRLPLMDLAYKMIEDNPLFGVGVNNFAINLPRYAGPEFTGVWLYEVHNVYLRTWAEMGIGGLLALLAFIATTLYLGWSCCKSKDRLLSILAIGLTATVASHAVHMMIDTFHDRQTVQLFWLIAGLLAAMYRKNKLKQVGTWR